LLSAIKQIENDRLETDLEAISDKYQLAQGKKSSIHSSFKAEEAESRKLAEEAKRLTTEAVGLKATITYRENKIKDLEKRLKQNGK
jgi:predicted nuclease with TOPRIM domain